MYICIAVTLNILELYAFFTSAVLICGHSQGQDLFCMEGIFGNRRAVGRVAVGARWWRRAVCCVAVGAEAGTAREGVGVWFLTLTLNMWHPSNIGE